MALLMAMPFTTIVEYVAVMVHRVIIVILAIGRIGQSVLLIVVAFKRETERWRVQHVMNTN